MAERSETTDDGGSVASRVVVVLVTVLLGGGIAAGASHHAAELFGVPVPYLALTVAFGLNWLAFVPAYLSQTEHYYDLTGSITYLSVVGIAVAGGPRDPRALILGAMVAVWALRLGTFLFRRIQKAGKDGRFDRIKTSASRFLVAWSLQGLWVTLTACAAVAAMTSVAPAPLGVLDVVGAAVWLLGFGIEVVADRQKSAFKAENPTGFITSGLWAWSRHPNYFGEIVLWLGIAIIAASTLVGAQWVTMISPVFVFVLLTRVSGVPMLERRADKRWGDDPAYQTYKAQTPELMLRPPRGA